MSTVIDFPNLTALCEALQDSAQRTTTYFSLDPILLKRSYAPGKWTVRQLLHHLADAETVLYERIRRGIARPKQVVYGFDQDAWANQLKYQDRPLHLNAAVFQATREAVMDLAKRYYTSHGSQQYVHSETGLRTVKEEFDKVAWHNLHHLGQIEKALEL